MEFMVALGSFLAFGLAFCVDEYIIINYFLGDDDYYVMAFMTPLILMLAIFSLVFMVCELLQPGISHSQFGRNTILLAGWCFSAITVCSVAWYNNNHCFVS